MKYRALTLATLALTLGTTSLITASLPAASQEPGSEQAPGGWDQPPREFRDIQRQGFHDGIEGARKDFDHHRAPNVNGRDEYRHPHVPPSARDDYRDGFRRGFDAAMHHLMGEGGR
jgi:hypothetical protein